MLAVPTQPDDQRPLGSGFGAHTAAAEVLAGVDLTGRTALVTGGYSGIGLEVVRALHGAGARGRWCPPGAPSWPRRSWPGSTGSSVGELDLADQASVAAYAASVAGRRSTW